MPVLSAAAYYVASIPRLATGFRRPHHVAAALLGLARRPFEVELRRHGLRFRIRDAMDLWILKEACLDDAYLPPDVRPEPGWSVLDVGAGIGDFAILMASRCPGGVVHAYEPMPDSFALLRSNVAANAVGNVVAHQVAVAGRAGRLTLSLPAGVPTMQARFVRDEAGGVSVPARDLASALEGLPRGECDLLKIDCEGGEYDVLLGAGPSVLRRVRRISIELHDGFGGHRADEIVLLLRSHGFVVAVSPNPVHRHLSHLYGERPTAAAPPRPSAAGVRGARG